MDKIKGDQKMFWRDIGKLGIGKDKNKSLPKEAIIETDKVIHNPDEVKHVWKEHFYNVLNPSCNIQAPSETTFTTRPELQILEELQEPLNAAITQQEVFCAIQKARKGKACGLDEIPVELLGSLPVQQYLTRLYNACFQSGLVHTCWNHGVLQPVIKDSSIDFRIIKNYRGITLIPHICKLYSAIINFRLSKYVEYNKVLHDEQNGFLKERSCQDQLQSFLSIVQTRKSQGSDTYCAFVDFSKAYDTISRPHLWFKLDKLGISGKMLGALQSLYNNTRCSVKTSHGLTEEFEIERGLKQGCLVSPLLFNLYLSH